MLGRVAVVLACVLGAGSAVAEELGADEARAFVVGKLFAYNCFDGTSGMGRIFADGSVIGTIRQRGRVEVRFAALPPGTIRVNGAAMCAHLSNLPIEPCFKVQRIDYRSFRGSISGMGFAYCDFYQRNPRNQLTSSTAVQPPRPSVSSASSASPAIPVSPVAPVASEPLPIATLRPASDD